MAAKWWVGFWWEGSEPKCSELKVHIVIPIMAVPENSGLIVRDATGVFLYMHSSTILLSYLCEKLKLIPQ